MIFFKYFTPQGYTSWKVAFLPLILGPTAFTCMYFYMKLRGSLAVEERGLFEFHSTTIGDFIILPLTWILMSQYYLLISSEQLNRSVLVLIGVLTLAGSITTFLVVSSIYGDYRDWTLPSFGKINFPGIYHSAFMGFMFSVYILFIFDHWHLITKMDKALALKPSEIYWYVINLLTIFVAVFWSDWFYKGKQINYFWINAPQQLGWVLFLFINIFLTLKFKVPPYNNALLWLGKELLVISIAIFIGHYLSVKPFFWQ